MDVELVEMEERIGFCCDYVDCCDDWELEDVVRYC